MRLAMIMRVMLLWLGLITAGRAAAGRVDILEIVRRPVPDHVVVLTFDDAINTQATFVAPLLKKYGFGGTFFVCDFISNPVQAKMQRFMTWPQIRALNEMGFEVGNHTAHHVVVRGLPKAKLTGELKALEDRCRENHIPVPTSFCYPGEATDVGELGTLAERGYLFARGGASRPYRPTTDHPLLVPAFEIHDGESQRFYSAVKQATWGQVVVLMFHGVPDKGNPAYSLEPKLFEEFMKYLHDNHYTVLALRDLSRYIDPVKARQWIEEHEGK